MLKRRELIQGGGLALLGALTPRLAFAATQPELMPHIREVIARWVGPDKLPGIVAVLGLPGKAPQFVSIGAEGFDNPEAVGPDSLFRVYSMTKPITAMAAMMLIDAGKMQLDQPLSDILPKFAQMQVLAVPNGPLADVRPAKTPITIRHLLTHTAGLGYTIISQGPIKQAYDAAGLQAGRITKLPLAGFGGDNQVTSLEQFVDRLAPLPLVYEPGTRWSYSVALDVMSRVIEVVSGQPFDQFLQHRLFDPLGMTSSYFQVPANQAHRLTSNYAAVGKVLVAIDKGASSIFLEKPPSIYGGSGLVSSPRDYDRFLHMLANFGTLHGQRVMRESAVRLATGNLLPPGVTGLATIAPNSEFGAGGRVGTGPEAGIYGWSGAAGTVGTVDMRHGIRSAIFMQFMPPTALTVLNEYQKALHTDVMALPLMNLPK